MIERIHLKFLRRFAVSLRLYVRLLAGFALIFFSFVSSEAFAQTPSMGFTQLIQADGRMMTIFYPSIDPETTVNQGSFDLSMAPNGRVLTGNRHLIVISHGSGGSPWMHADLARTLVRHGFTVVIPLHQGDNYIDPSEPGPPSWRKRPHEVSAAIDAIANYAPLAKHLSFFSVGVFGGSAGGHTVLSLAGGQWSEQRFNDHCQKNIEQDFYACVGMTTRLKGNWLDGPKAWLARRVISARFSDETVNRYFDPRVRAAVAMVPFAADFIPESLAQPRVKLGLIVANKDVNLVPRFHVDAVLKRCAPNCELVMDLQEAGHGAMLSPLPPLKKGSLEDYLLGDPPLFNRAQTIPQLNERIADFFIRHLTGGEMNESGKAPRTDAPEATEPGQ